MCSCWWRNYFLRFEKLISELFASQTLSDGDHLLFVWGGLDPSFPKNLSRRSLYSICPSIQHLSTRSFWLFSLSSLYQLTLWIYNIHFLTCKFCVPQFNTKTCSIQVIGPSFSERQLSVLSLASMRINRQKQTVCSVPKKHRWSSLNFDTCCKFQTLPMSLHTLSDEFIL